MFLTPDDLAYITGYQRAADQRRWLTLRGWVFEVSRAGRPIVSRAHAEMRLGGILPAGPTVRKAPALKLDAIRKAA